MSFVYPTLPSTWKMLFRRGLPKDEKYLADQLETLVKQRRIEDCDFQHFGTVVVKYPRAVECYKKMVASHNGKTTLPQNQHLPTWEVIVHTYGIAEAADGKAVPDAGEVTSGPRIEPAQAPHRFVFQKFEGALPERGIVTYCHVVNPQDFPIAQLQDLRGVIIKNLRVCSQFGQIVGVAANLENAPFKFLRISDPNVLHYLGFTKNVPHIEREHHLDPDIFFRLWTFRLGGYVWNNVGELVQAWHAFHYWFQWKGEAASKNKPEIADIQAIANYLSRPLEAVRQEIMDKWEAIGNGAVA
ncbi:hypothetical protein EJ04DRAFT_561926 [Polyplosphaeria fusca]|uniref:Uncharacterized protein n=1 Tax=Polyplosphaeria fusca TaxID=682080 RepID=A0A9P4R591_9PLEO|nr:hypothetical protein EJ04DRAFT_561926 [Polyplosphaeria fusca]